MTLVIGIVIGYAVRGGLGQSADKGTADPGGAGIAKSEDIELTNGIVSTGSREYTLTGSVTNTGTDPAPKVKVWGVIENFGFKDWSTGKGKFPGNHRGLLGEFTNLRPGESREFTFLCPTRVYVREIQTIDKSKMSEYEASQNIISADAPRIEFEVLPT